jgi:hypothetical protein
MKHAFRISSAVVFLIGGFQGFEGAVRCLLVSILLALLWIGEEISEQTEPLKEDAE